VTAMAVNTNIDKTDFFHFTTENACTDILICINAENDLFSFILAVFNKLRQILIKTVNWVVGTLLQIHEISQLIPYQKRTVCISHATIC
jgi:hypothetical protein